MSWTAGFPLPDSKGNLKVNFKRGTRVSDKVPVLILELTATGPAADSMEKAAMLKWFDLGHEWIVRGFTDLTTPEAHRLWEREDV